MEPKICAICVDNLEEVALCPCNHRLCQRCSEQVETCPFCRGHIDGARPGLFACALSAFVQRPAHFLRRAPPGVLENLPQVVKRHILQRTFATPATKRLLHGSTLRILLKGADCTKLDVSYGQCIVDADLQKVASDLRHLRQFDGSCAPQLKDEGILVILRSAPNLGQLILQGLQAFTGEAFGADKTLLPALHTLDLTDCRSIQQPMLESIGSRCSLRSISLRNCAQLSDEALHFLRPACRGMLVCNLSGCWRFSAAAVLHFVAASEIGVERLNVGGCDGCHGPTLLKGVAAHRGSHGTLTDCDFTRLPDLDADALSVFLAACGAALQRLVLQKCEDVSDGCVSLIRDHCPHLRELDLSWTSVGELPVMDLARSAQRLIRLDVSRCPHVKNRSQFLILQLLEGRHSSRGNNEDQEENSFVQGRTSVGDSSGSLRGAMSEQRSTESKCSASWGAGSVACHTRPKCSLRSPAQDRGMPCSGFDDSFAGTSSSHAGADMAPIARSSSGAGTASASTCPVGDVPNGSQLRSCGDKTRLATSLSESTGCCSRSSLVTSSTLAASTSPTSSPSSPWLSPPSSPSSPSSASLHALRRATTSLSCPSSSAVSLSSQGVASMRGRRRSTAHASSGHVDAGPAKVLPLSSGLASSSSRENHDTRWALPRSSDSSGASSADPHTSSYYTGHQRRSAFATVAAATGLAEQNSLQGCGAAAPASLHASSNTRSHPSLLGATRASLSGRASLGRPSRRLSTDGNGSVGPPLRYAQSERHLSDKGFKHRATQQLSTQTPPLRSSTSSASVRSSLRHCTK